MDNEDQNATFLTALDDLQASMHEMLEVTKALDPSDWRGDLAGVQTGMMKSQLALTQMILSLAVHVGFEAPDEPPNLRLV